MHPPCCLSTAFWWTKRPPRNALLLRQQALQRTLLAQLVLYCILYAWYTSMPFLFLQHFGCWWYYFKSSDLESRRQQAHMQSANNWLTTNFYLITDKSVNGKSISWVSQSSKTTLPYYWRFWPYSTIWHDPSHMLNSEKLHVPNVTHAVQYGTEKPHNLTHSPREHTLSQVNKRKTTAFVPEP